jgi:hypothetical protein
MQIDLGLHMVLAAPQLAENPVLDALTGEYQFLAAR